MKHSTEAIQRMMNPPEKFEIGGKIFINGIIWIIADIKYHDGLIHFILHHPEQPIYKIKVKPDYSPALPSKVAIIRPYG